MTPKTRIDAARAIDAAVGQADELRGGVQVTVDRNGRVNSVVLSDHVLELPAVELAEHIQKACARAYNDRLRRVSKILSETAHLFDPATIERLKAVYARVKEG
ncbi:hypothetical protein ACQ7HM_05115 [Williamsia sp. MIQD14]|uniref:hypothetical protein n=1 Tax=Williamsia sp. MIQD14 TaxID=3425703 RepID=UPI003DA19B73